MFITDRKTIFRNFQKIPISSKNIANFLYVPFLQVNSNKKIEL